MPENKTTGQTKEDIIAFAKVQQTLKIYGVILGLVSTIIFPLTMKYFDKRLDGISENSTKIAVMQTSLNAVQSDVNDIAEWVNDKPKQDSKLAGISLETLLPEWDTCTPPLLAQVLGYGYDTNGGITYDF